MGTSIGNMAVQLSANADALSQGLKKAEDQLAGWAKSAAKLVASPFSSATQLATSPGRIFGAFTSPLKDAASSIPFVGKALARAFDVGGLEGKITERMSSIASTAREAKLLGTSVSELSGLQAAAGGDAEAFSAGLAHLSRELGQARAGSEEAQFGFSKLGIDYKKLGDLSQTDRVKQIADKIKGLKDPTEQAAVAFQLFGRGGQEMLPTLLKGSEGFDAAGKKARAFNLDLSDLDAAQVVASKKAIGDMNKAVEGMVNNLTIAAAPAIQGLADAFTPLIKQLGEATRATRGWYDNFQIGLAAIADGFDSGEGLGGGDRVKALQQQIAERNAELTKKQEGAASLKPAELGAAADKLAKSLQDQVAAYGQGAGALEVYKLSQQGATDKQLEAAKAAAEQLDTLKKLEGLTPRGANFLEQFASKQKDLGEALEAGKITLETYTNALAKLNDEQKKAERAEGVKATNEAMDGLEKYTKRIEELKDLTAKGELSPDRFRQLAGKGFEDLSKSILGEYKTPGAALQGSAEAFSAIVKAQGEGRFQDPNVRLAMIQQVLTEQKAYLEKIAQQLNLTKMGL